MMHGQKNIKLSKGVGWFVQKDLPDDKMAQLHWQQERHWVLNMSHREVTIEILISL